MRDFRSLRAVLFTLVLLSISSASFAQIAISVRIGPPALPVYVQPVCPGEGYIWTPGYWAWDGYDYYWVPGTWVLAPEPGYLWTPPWWGWENGFYLFHPGWWGVHVGFYGGINYGFGYFGDGFVGGRWDHDRFFYNRSVTNVNVTNITNVYNQTVINNTTNINRVSYNGGPGGVQARMHPGEEAAMRERHLEPVSAQVQHEHDARNNPGFRASENHGRPPVAATSRPGEFRGGEAVPAKEAGAPYKGIRGGNAVHPKELPPFERPSPPNTGSVSRDRKFQQQQDKLFSRQDQERQKLQQRQDREHQQLERQKASDTRMQQSEQRHMQQTQQMQERHVQQQQHLQEHQSRR